ncbi:alpha/beta hydrolase [Spongiibacter nanhainus]|uniref:Alpha/beta hydrolase n=1 Tax=Spongiibacter nanhainus TaxID=2794344 RepID=A0A7T4UQI9_9GAMM|nr:alpha/beta hydrolase [Spongiibacter nanhainus]QQD18798.1 alpha/beta hydrolase [Spongiibacter nanhainus]
MKLILLVAGVLALVACASLRGGEPYSRQTGVVYKEVDGQALAGDIYLPNKPGLKPAVVVVHGGGWTNRSGDMTGISKRLAKAGFVVYNITYRLAPAHRHPAQRNDVADALVWLHDNAERYQIDPQRIGGWGYSAGAHLILLAGLDRTSPPMLNGIVAGGTPADLTAWPNSPLVYKLIGKTLAEAESQWLEASPVNHVSEESPPVFLYHGEWDKLVEPEQMAFMADALSKKGVPVQTRTVSWQGHIGAYFFAGSAEREAVAFFKAQETGQDLARQ